MKLIFFGTNSGVPTIKRNTSCTILKFKKRESSQDTHPNITNNNNNNNNNNTSKEETEISDDTQPKKSAIVDDTVIWMVDCGEGTQHQFLRYADPSSNLNYQNREHNIAFSRLQRIFITHLHGDHCYGLPGLLAMCSMRGCTQPIEIVGPKGIKRYLETVFEVSQLYLPFQISFIELEENTPFEIGWRDDYHISAYPLTHRVPTFGYVFKERPINGDFDAAKAIQLGVPKGPLISTLVKKGEVSLSDGTVINVSQCLKESKPGVHVVVLGDTCNSDQIIEAAKDCDVLVHECTFDASMEDRAIKSGHSTSKMVGEFAKKVLPRSLIITHFSQRYVGDSVEITVNDLLQETIQSCNDSQTPIQVLAAHDFWSFDVVERWKKNKK